MDKCQAAGRDDDMVNKITVDSLNYASTVADVGSFNSAARRLGVTQPALSASVSKLEDHLGSRLFDRTTKGTTLTSFGEEVLPRIKHALSTISDIENSAHHFLNTSSRTLRVGISPKIDKEIAGTISNLIHAPGPAGYSFDLFLLEAEHRVLEKQLSDNMLDLILTPTQGRYPQYRYQHLYTDSLCLVDLRSDRSSSSTISLCELADIPLILCGNGCEISDLLEQCFSYAGLEMTRSEYQVSNCTALLGWAERKLGAVVVPASMVASDQHMSEIIDTQGRPLTINYTAVWHPASDQAMYIAATVDKLIRQTRPIDFLDNPS